MNRSSGPHEEDEALVSFEIAGSAGAAHPVRSPESGRDVCMSPIET